LGAPSVLILTETITRAPGCSSGGPQVGIGVSAYLLVSEDATSISYSQGNWSWGPTNDPYCFPDLWAPPPGNTGPGSGGVVVWIWSKISNTWTYGGWGDNTQFTGTYAFPNGGNPYVASDIQTCG
jgi:hypothetical protein